MLRWTATGKWTTVNDMIDNTLMLGRKWICYALCLGLIMAIVLNVRNTPLDPAGVTLEETTANNNLNDTKPKKSKKVLVLEGTSHVKLVYHRGHGGKGPASLRLAEEDDNNGKTWDQAPLVDLARNTSHLHRLLDVGFDGVVMDFEDQRFSELLKASLPKKAKKDGFQPAWKDGNGM